MIGADYSLARPGGAALKASGYTWVARYLCTYAPKRLSPEERDDLFANDLSIVLVFEDDAAQALNGYDQGILDAQEALGQANALGVPDSVPLYFAVDIDATEAQQTAINAYFQGVVSVLGIKRVGGYGGYWVLLRLADAGLISYKFQTIAWSGGNKVPGINIYQDGVQAFNGGVDEDISETTNFGQWSKGENMTVSKEEVEVLYMLAVPNQGVNQDFVAAYSGKNLDDVLHALQNDPSIKSYTSRLVMAESQVTTLQSQVQDLTTKLSAVSNSSVVNMPSQTQTVTIDAPASDVTPSSNVTPTVIITTRQNPITKFFKWLFK